MCRLSSALLAQMIIFCSTFHMMHSYETKNYHYQVAQVYIAQERENSYFNLGFLSTGFHACIRTCQLGNPMMKTIMYSPHIEMCNCRICVQQVVTVEASEDEARIAFVAKGVEDKVKLIQRRVSDSVDFNRSLEDYTSGFGSGGGSNSNYWMGLSSIKCWTWFGYNRLRIEMESFDDEKMIVEYNNFFVSAATNTFTLTIQGFEPITDGAVDNLSSVDHEPFVTYDSHEGNVARTQCATEHQSGWWCKSGMQSNLNGVYSNESAVESISNIFWQGFKGQLPLRKVEMKLIYRE